VGCGWRGVAWVRGALPDLDSSRMSGPEAKGSSAFASRGSGSAAACLNSRIALPSALPTSGSLLPPKKEAHHRTTTNSESQGQHRCSSPKYSSDSAPARDPEPS